MSLSSPFIRRPVGTTLLTAAVALVGAIAFVIGLIGTVNGVGRFQWDVYVSIVASYAYLFAYTLDVPGNAKTLTLPNNDKIRILAVTATDERGGVSPAQTLVDAPAGTER